MQFSLVSLTLQPYFTILRKMVEKKKKNENFIVVAL